MTIEQGQPKEIITCRGSPWALAIRPVGFTLGRSCGSMAVNVKGHQATRQPPLAGDCGCAPLLLVSRRLSGSSGTVSWRLSDPIGAIKNAPGLASQERSAIVVGPSRRGGDFCCPRAGEAHGVLGRD